VPRAVRTQRLLAALSLGTPRLGNLSRELLPNVDEASEMNLIVALLVLTLTPGPTAAAVHADLEVAVADVNGPLPGATVSLFDPGRPSPSMLTNAAGVALFENLPCGEPVTIGVSFPGFVTRRIEGVDACTVFDGRLDVCLDEEITERILLICTDGDIVDLETTRLSNVFRGGFLHDLPGAGGDARERTAPTRVVPRRDARRRPRRRCRGRR
jgi:hypothetical protein